MLCLVVNCTINSSSSLLKCSVVNLISLSWAKFALLSWHCFVSVTLALIWMLLLLFWCHLCLDVESRGTQCQSASVQSDGSKGSEAEGSSSSATSAVEDQPLAAGCAPGDLCGPVSPKENSRGQHPPPTSDRIHCTSLARDSTPPGSAHRLSAIDLSCLRLIENTRKTNKQPYRDSSGANGSQAQSRGGGSSRGRGRGRGRGKSAGSHVENHAIDDDVSDSVSETPRDVNSPAGHNSPAAAGAYSIQQTDIIGQQTPLMTATFRSAMCEGRVPGHTGYLTFAVLTKSQH